jgi:hypothetical protein
MSLIIEMFQFVSELTADVNGSRSMYSTNHMHKSGHTKHTLIALFKISTTSAKQF